ncbi:MAG: hypothetical protein K0S32_4250 [Bacteroidetes bacterium]|jgi:hypothetical protein|nr:hypothetical protein [Bacteroidota bacterium]
MKKIINLCCAALVVTSFMSCGDKKKEQEAIVAPQGMHVLDLSKFGKPFAIFVPDTTAAKLEIVQQTYGALDIKVGKGFNISINEQAADIEMKKKDVKEDEVNKFKSFVVEEPTAIFWESEITQPEFHFIINQKIGNTEYSIEDVKATEAEPFSKESIQKMFDSAKNIKEIKKEPSA